MSRSDAIGTPEGAPVPEVPPAEPAPPEEATITLEDVQGDRELSLYIASADRVSPFALLAPTVYQYRVPLVTAESV